MGGPVFRKNLLLAMLVLLSFKSEAQFPKKKFKSKTDFNPSNRAADNNANPSGEASAPSDESVKPLLDQASDAPEDSSVEPTEASEVTSEEGSENGQDYFGREGEENSFIAGEGSKDKKYVNLNTETAFGPEVITSFDFPDVSLTDLTKHMQKLTGMNIILDKDLKGKVSIMAPSPITVGDAWKAYLTALNVNGYTLVNSGAFYKIVNSRDIRYTPTKIYTGSFTPDTENYVMRVIPLKNIDSTEVTRSFRPFMSRYGRIIDIKQTNTVIVQDTGDNINRLIKLIKFIDVPGHEESLQIFPVKNSSASEIAKLLDQILKSKGTGTSSSGARRSSTAASNNIKIIAEPRTNSIIAMANADEAKNLRNLIQKLDSKVANSGSGQIHVYYLNFGDAEKLSKTLSDLVSGSKSGASAARTSRFTSTNSTSSDSLFSAEVKVTADKDNNALVITASPTDYLTIKSVIAKLDIPRDQVYVEGLIMETTIDRNSEFGISIIGKYGAGTGEVVGSLQGKSGTTLINLLSGNPASLGGLFAPIGGGSDRTLQIGDRSIPIKSVSGLISALATDSDSNVLATPQVLALDNEEAVFEVGEEIPARESATGANGITQFSNKPQKVTLKLTLKPHINKASRFIKLKIKVDANDFSNRSLPDALAGSGLATTVRQADSTVIIRDKDTIAMGGLMRDSLTENVSKVPLLGDIPILGWLFKNKTKASAKKNLLIFLTPKILASYEDTAAATLKDVINRRGAHLKDALGEDDPFRTTVKGLYQKAKKQEEGPLFDEEAGNRYKKLNEEKNDSAPKDEEIEELNLDESVEAEPAKKDTKDAQASYMIPDYNNIVQEVDVQQSATK
jgi:general secretion pathway protein D